MDSDIRIIEARPYFSAEKPKFLLRLGSNNVIKETTFCQVRMKAENRKGETGFGYGGIFLSHFWAFPNPDISHEEKDKAMRAMTEIFCGMVAGYGSYAHPIKIFMDLEKDLLNTADEITGKFSFKEKFPVLACLVSASPVDGALHDAFGNVNRISSYDGYGREFMDYDLSVFLGEKFKGKYIGDYIKKEYPKSIPVFHTVGGLDKLTKAEVSKEDYLDDFPNCLEEWIKQDGLFCFKLKSNGRDLKWDVQRVLDVHAIAHQIYSDKEIYITADPNEQCEDTDYVVEFLRKLKEASPQAYEELLYVEQPIKRDLERYSFDMRGIAEIKPVIIDESLIGFKEYEMAKELGWSGIALKSCKCQSKELLLMAKATEDNIPYAVQDLTNPGIALLQSTGFASRINPIKGVEANSVQFFPDASIPEAKVHPGVFNRRNGVLNLETLTGYGLGYQMERIGRRWED